MRKLLVALAVLLPLGALAWWMVQSRNRPPEVPFAYARRETLVSTLPTNGKVEPLEWEAARTSAAGLVERVPVKEGQAVAAGATLAVMARSGLEAELSAAEARLAQARADLATLEAGGAGAELAQIAGSTAKARHAREEAARELAALERLVAKEAATAAEVAAARARLRQAELEVESLERRRGALVSRNDVDAARARVRDAEAAVQLARARINDTVIRAGAGGVLYGLEVRPGSYLQPGDLVANVGRMDRLRVRVYVDEPELGRVAVGQPVTITWDALPGRTWLGTVERKPPAVVALGTRQVGEVVATIENPGRDLVPGTNVNAEIRTNVSENALTIPKEALRRQGGDTGVFLLRDGVLAWQAVQTGSSNVARVQIVSGLKERDAVALQTETPLEAGRAVTAVYPDGA